MLDDTCHFPIGGKKISDLVFSTVVLFRIVPCHYLEKLEVEGHDGRLFLGGTFFFFFSMADTIRSLPRSTTKSMLPFFQSSLVRIHASGEEGETQLFVEG